MGLKPELLTIVYDRKRATGKKSHAISFHLAGPGRSIVRWSDLWPAGECIAAAKLKKKVLFSYLLFKNNEKVFDPYTLP